MTSPPPSIEQLIREFLARPEYLPMRQHELARALGLNSGSRREFRGALKRMEEEGRIVQLRKNRWALPHAGKQRTGILKVHRNGFGFVIPDDGSTDDVFIPAKALQQAIHDDRVLVSVIRLPSARRGRNAGGPGAAPRTEGRVLRVLERRRGRMVGLLKRTPHYWYVIPDDVRIQYPIRLANPPKDGRDLRVNDKVVLELAPWDDSGQPPTGALLEVLGPMDTPGIEMLSLMRRHTLDDAFTQHIENAARKVSPLPSDTDFEGRRDLRGLRTVTIDPADANDYDDAVSLKQLDDGRWQLWVHIADVAHYVQPGTDIDREAYERATSVYLVDRVVTMLPPFLTKEVCSLTQGVDRLSHTVELILQPDGEVISMDTYPSIIHSDACLDYDRVQRLFDGDTAPGLDKQTRSLLLHMKELSQSIRAARTLNGSLAFNLPEVKCLMDRGGTIREIVRRESKEAYQLIEEFMLLANQAVARILSEREVPSMYRIHEEPDPMNWEKMGADLAALGVSLTGSTPAELNRIAAEVAGTPIEYPVNLAILRNLKRATYTAHRAVHFGLAFTHYTHFTSPIRRYPDLVVHRILRSVEENKAAPYAREDLERMAAHCSEMEQKAQEAENESVEIMRVLFYHERLKDGDIGPFDGTVVSLVPKGLIVELSDTLQRGMVPFSSLGDDYYRLNEERTEARGRRTKRVWRLGDVLRVELLRVDTARRLVDFWLDAPEDEASVSRGRRKGKKRKRGQRIR